MDHKGPKIGIWRSLAVTLSVLAIALKVLTPSGFMMAQQAGGFPLVICTGQGPMVITDHGDQKAPAHKTADTPCAFAGLGATLAPDLGGQVALVSQIDLHLVQQAPWTDQTDGRRMAAPPPQAHAPPVSSELI